MKKTLLILIILSLPLISKGSDNLVAVLYLKNGSYVSSDSVYTFLNLDGTLFDELRSRNGNEPTCLKIDRDNAVSYYPDLMIYVFFCKLSPTRNAFENFVNMYSLVFADTQWCTIDKAYARAFSQQNFLDKQG